MSAPTGSQSALVWYASPVGGGILLPPLPPPLPPPQATTIDDKQNSVIHVLRDMTFPFKLIQQGAFVAHKGGLMHESLAKIPSFFPEDSKKTSSGTRPSRSRRSISWNRST